MRIENLVIHCESAAHLKQLSEEHEYIGAAWAANYARLTLTILARRR